MGPGTSTLGVDRRRSGLMRGSMVRLVYTPVRPAWCGLLSLLYTVYGACYCAQWVNQFTIQQVSTQEVLTVALPASPHPCVIVPGLPAPCLSSGATRGAPPLPRRPRTPPSTLPNSAGRTRAAFASVSPAWSVVASPAHARWPWVTATRWVAV